MGFKPTVPCPVVLDSTRVSGVAAGFDAEALCPREDVTLLTFATASCLAAAVSWRTARTAASPAGSLLLRPAGTHYFGGRNADVYTDVRCYTPLDSFKVAKIKVEYTALTATVLIVSL